MGLQKYQICNEAHTNDIEYCCMKTNTIYCRYCWYKDNHPYRCSSSRCGHYEKLAHSVIDKNLQMKIMQFTASMCSSYDKFINNFRAFDRFKKAITFKIRNDIQSKLPLFIWSSIADMLSFKNPKLSQMIYEQSSCSDMLKIIKKRDDVSKSKCLQEVVQNMERAYHLCNGLQNKLKQKNYTENMDQEIQQIVTFCERQADPIVARTNVAIKKDIEMEIDRVLKELDSSLQFQGVKFDSKKSFQLVEMYSTPSLLDSIIEKPNNTIFPYHGITFEIQSLEQCPEQLLEISKSILKQKIFNMHSNYKQMKSSYPYKYGYLIATTFQPDPQYQLSVIDLQKAFIKSYERKSEFPFMNSIHLIIMGPQLITIQFKNYPRKITDINIFGYKDSRQKFITDLIQIHLGLGKDKSDQRKINKFTFESSLTPTQLAYVQFQLAYEQLFTDQQDRAEFEGEKYALARGIKLLQEIANGWKNNAVIQLTLADAEEKYMPYVI